jgi:hypothetical protein
MVTKLPFGEWWGHKSVFHKWVKCQPSHNRSWVRGWSCFISSSRFSWSKLLLSYFRLYLCYTCITYSVSYCSLREWYLNLVLDCSLREPYLNFFSDCSLCEPYMYFVSDLSVHERYLNLVSSSTSRKENQ